MLKVITSRCPTEVTRLGHGAGADTPPGLHRLAPGARGRGALVRVAQGRGPGESRKKEASGTGR